MTFERTDSISHAEFRSFNPKKNRPINIHYDNLLILRYMYMTFKGHIESLKGHKVTFGSPGSFGD
jgi:hypothetical protein